MSLFALKFRHGLSQLEFPFRRKAALAENNSLFQNSENLDIVDQKINTWASLQFGILMVDLGLHGELASHSARSGNFTRQSQFRSVRHRMNVDGTRFRCQEGSMRCIVKPASSDDHGRSFLLCSSVRFFYLLHFRTLGNYPSIFSVRLLLGVDISLEAQCFKPRQSAFIALVPVCLIVSAEPFSS